MRKLLLSVWLIGPVGAVAYHYGPGQDRLRVDAAATAIAEAETAASEAREIAAKKGDREARDAWSVAEEACSKAIAALPADRIAELRTLKLARAKAQMMISKLPDARRDLEALVEELSSDPTSDRTLKRDAQRTLASARYFTTWLLRLEGVPREEWGPEIESARQTQKHLAEEAERIGDLVLAKAAREDLESAIRLERMAIGELQGLPLPSQ